MTQWLLIMLLWMVLNKLDPNTSWLAALICAAAAAWTAFTWIVGAVRDVGAML
jgi:hypothetical protein